MNQLSESSENPKPAHRRLKTIAISIGAAVVIALMVKATVAEVFYAATDRLTPEVPQGARVLACKLCRALDPGDIVVYRADDRTFIGRVTAIDEQAQSVTIDRNGQPAVTLNDAQIVGRVVGQSR